MGVSVGVGTRRYVAGRAERGEIAPETVASLRQILGLFADFVGRERAVADVTRHDIVEWIGRAKAPSTKRHRLSAVRTFYAWAQLEGYCRHDPTLGVKPPKPPRRIPRCIPAAAGRRTVLACATPRERAIVALMLTDGLRAKEVATLELADIDLLSRVLMVRHGKGEHERPVPLADDAVRAIEDYLAVRGRVGGRFILSEGNHPYDGIRPRRVVQIVSAIMHRAAAGETGHALRHTFARDFLKAGGDMRALMGVLGHASLNTTLVYTPFVAVEEMRPYVGSTSYLGPDGAA